MKTTIKNILPLAVLALSMGMSSCTKDLDVEVLDPNKGEYSVEGLFKKCYANMVLPGNGGADGDSDLDGYDGGTAGFVRQMWNCNELPTDEAICGWGDAGIKEFCFNTFDASHPMTAMFYFRLTNGITYCNDYLERAADFNKTMTAEIRFVRALHYYYLMDCFGNVPFTTQTISTTGEIAKPEQKSRAEVYSFIESELLDLVNDLSEPAPKKFGDAGYGRADKAAAWLLLARLYLNAEVYTGTAKWEEARDYAKLVMDSSYKLHTNGTADWSAYQMLFMADNGETDAAYEAILPLLQDGLTTTSWGSATFLTGSTFAGDMHANKNNENSSNGTSQNWSGNRARPDLVKKFFSGAVPEVASYDMTAAAGDDRAIFWGINRNLDCATQPTFTDGYSVAKWINFRSDNGATHDPTFPDFDVFLMRKAEAYLTYAEACARLNGGKAEGDAAEAINKLRERANNASRPSAYSLDEILDEWSREFYFEGRRRIDLVRFDKFGGNNNYNWQWKGGDYKGTNFPKSKNVYPIPAADLTSNSNLKQNPGY
ncbi:MAG: RagB/SusD family nutrient uptake outer membrane protein [Prevotella sp.]|nr:RagB/SusD family nutrient uptake outer membrane protein [Prevotella sp.]